MARRLCLDEIFAHDIFVVCTFWFFTPANFKLATMVTYSVLGFLVEVLRWDAIFVLRHP